MVTVGEIPYELAMRIFLVVWLWVGGGGWVGGLKVLYTFCKRLMTNIKMHIIFNLTKFIWSHTSYIVVCLFLVFFY